jgi:hypothetical protein
MRGASLLRSLAVLVAVGTVGLFSTTARSADMPVMAAPVAGCTQAVDGINGELEGLGGSSDNDSVYGALGSLSAPLGCGYGMQLDATAANLDSRFLGAIAGHLFWRDPSKGLLGIYGSYVYWDQVGGIDIAHISPEAEWHLGRWTLKGIAGVEFGNDANGSVGGNAMTYDIKTRFFDQVNLAYYITDDFKTYIGHRYLGGKNALALGGEFGIPLGHGIMAALFTEGRIGEDDDHGVWGGVRFYFGQTDKTLIRRHREDDPSDWDLGIDGTGNTGVSNTGASVPSCPPNYILVNDMCHLNVQSH